MFFRKKGFKVPRKITWILTTSLLITTLFFISSCNLKIGEKPPEKNIPGFKTDSCLIKATNFFSEYFKGESNVNDINSSWDCFATMVVTFQKNVRCNKINECTPDELSKFVEDNFLEEDGKPQDQQKKISPELKKQLMKVKKLFLGGRLDYISPIEFELLVKLMNNLKSLFVELNPSMKILTLNWESKLQSGDVTLQDFGSVNTTFVKVIQKFSSLIFKTENEYFFDDFYSFLSEVAHFTQSSTAWLNKLAEFIPLVKKMKKSITGGSEDSVKDKEWDLLLTLGGRGYLQFLRYYYFIKNINPEFTSLKLAYYAKTIEESFLIFYDLLDGKDSHRISKEEIDEILSSFSNIWKDFKSSPELTKELMKIKKIIIGGGVESIEKEEFRKAQSKVTAIKEVVEDIIRYYQLYGLAWKPELLTKQEAEKEFHDAIKNFDFLVDKIINDVKFESGYSYSDFLSLVKEFEKIYPKKEASQKFEVILNKYCGLAQIGVDILNNKNNFELGYKCNTLSLTSSDLAVLLKKSSEIYAQILNYFYFIKNKTFYKVGSEYQSKVRDLILKSLDFLKLVISDRKLRQISYKEMDGIFSEGIRLDIIPNNIRSESFKKLTRALLEKIFIDPELIRMRQRIVGIEPSHISMMKKDLLNYTQLSLYFNLLYENKTNNIFNFDFFIENIQNAIKISSDPYLVIGAKEFLKHFKSPYPISINEDRKVFLDEIRNPVFNFEGIQQMNLSRFLAGLILRSYSQQAIDGKTLYNEVKKCEFKEAFRDVRPLLIDLDVLNSNTTDSFIDSRFLEGNIFLPNSDGNDELSFQEIADLSNYIFSGINVQSKIKEKVMKKCNISKENSLEYVDLSCLRGTYDDNLSEIFQSMPNYLKYIESIKKENPLVWQSTFFNSLKASGYISNNENKVSIYDANVLPHMFQYSETVFLKFDKNNDGFIDKEEGFLAFPTFEKLLKKVARKQIENGVIAESEFLPLFTYILKYKDIPSCEKPFKLLCLLEKDIRRWLDWKSNYKKTSYKLSVDRSELAIILGLIADLVSSSPSVQEDSRLKKEECI